jgi:hypothetical protein
MKDGCLNRVHPGSAFDGVPAQFSRAFQPGSEELDPARRGEIDRVLFAGIGQAVGLVGRPAGQQFSMRRAVEEIKGAGGFPRAPCHALGQIAVPEVLFVEPRRGAPGENVPPKPLRRLRLVPNNPPPSLPYILTLASGRGAARRRCRRP